MKKIVFWGYLFSLTALFAGGCRSNAYYQDRAIERARDFVSENAKELSPNEIAYIRFNKPTFLMDDILPEPTSGLAGAISSGFSQICITWDIPGRDELYMVYGVSNSSMSEWRPKRLIRKTFVQPDSRRLAAIAAARSYALSNMYNFLDESQYNHLRFTEPELIRSDFVLPLNPDGLLLPEEVAILQAKEQYSLIWQMPEKDGKVIVFSGQSNSQLTGWSVISGGIYSRAEVAARTLPVETGEK